MRPFRFMAAGLALMALASGPGRAEDRTAQLRVFVIAVHDFDREPKAASLYDKGVDDAITEALAELVKFFSDHYGVTPIELATRTETQGQAVRAALDKYFSDNSQYSINFVFVLTHGLGRSLGSGSPYNSRLYLATSDTNNNNYTGTALQARELINYFESGLRPGSSVFLFLDTCQSGAIDNPGLQDQLDNDWKSSTRIMIIASSEADQKSYGAQFTKALVSLWKAPVAPENPPCTRDRTEVEKLLTAKVNDPKQQISVVFPYTDNFCIESLGTDWGLALIYNPLPSPMDIVIRDVDTDAKVFERRLKGQEVFPERLPRKQYRLVASSPNPGVLGERITKKLDLEHPDYIQYVPLGNTVDYVTMNQSYETAISAATSLGATDAQVAQLRDGQIEELKAAVLDQGTHVAVAGNEVKNKQQEASAWERIVAEAEVAEAKAKDTVDQSEAAMQTKLSKISPLAVVMGDLRAAQKQVSDAEAGLVETQRVKADAAQSSRRTQVALDEANLKLEVEQNLLTRLQTLLSSLEEKRANSLRQASAFTSIRRSLAEQIRKAAPVEESDRGLVLRLNPTDRGQLALDTKKQLDSLAAALKSYESLHLEVEAYAANGNVASAQRRADSVAAYLKSLIPTVRLKARGFGKVALLPANTNEPLGYIGDRLEVVISGETLGVGTAH